MKNWMRSLDNDSDLRELLSGIFIGSAALAAMAGAIFRTVQLFAMP